jgi:hypothetical protein
MKFFVSNSDTILEYLPSDTRLLVIKPGYSVIGWDETSATVADSSGNQAMHCNYTDMPLGQAV